MTRSTAPAAGMNIISLGAGVQSTTMLLMAMAGEIEPMPDCAIFADTGWEPQAVYDHLAWLESVSTIEIIRATKGNIRSDLLERVNGIRKHMSHPPLFVANADGGRGVMPRQCTRDYKIYPVRRAVRAVSAGHGCVLWMGISLDEIERMKDSSVKYISNRYPLVEKRLMRWDCLNWMEANGYPTPPRSACVGCPYRSNREWRSLTESEFGDAVAVDRAIRDMPRVRGQAFLHSSLQPLDMVDLRTEQEKGQLDLWGDECEGMCGL